MRAVSPLRQRFPFGGLLLAAICGVLFASWLGASWWLAMVLLVCWVVLLPFGRRGGHVMALTAALFAMLQLWSWNEAPARKLALWFDVHPEEFSVEGIVAAEPKVSATGLATFPLRVERIAWEREMDGASRESATTVPVTVQVRWTGTSPLYGDRVRFQAPALRPPPPRNPGEFDYRTWLERHGIYTEFSMDPSEPGEIVSHNHGSPVMAWALASRHRMETILGIDMEGPSGELSAIKGITLGITEGAPAGFTDDFRFTGTMHLFAVSGLHVGMLAVMIWFVLRAGRLPRPWAVGLIIPILFFYVAITGLKSGSIRSATMISLLLCGSVLYRRSPMFNTLAAAALLQLALDTNTLFSAGWQFSYSVVFAILAVAPLLESRLGALHEPDPFLPPKLLTRRERLGFSVWKYAVGLLAVSAAAWLGSLLPTVAYFHLISLSAIGANLLAVPLAFAVLALGALSLLAGSISLWVAGAFNNANWLVTKLLLLVVQASAMMPGGHWFIGPPAKPYPVVTLLDLGGASCVAIRSGGQFALIDAGRRRDASREVLPFLESNGANVLQSVLISKSDASHLGGLPEILREVKAKRLGFPDSIPRSSVGKAVLATVATAASPLQSGATWPLLRGAEAEILNLPHDGQEDPGDREAGNKTLIVRLRCGGIRILFLPHLTPDFSRQLLAARPESLHADLLVMPLGGSELLSTLEVIRRIAPGALISRVDAMNRNGVPSREWESLLAAEKIAYLRQDETGAVIIDANPLRPILRGFLPPQKEVSLGDSVP